MRGTQKEDYRHKEHIKITLEHRNYVLNIFDIHRTASRLILVQIGDLQLCLASFALFLIWFR